MAKFVVRVFSPLHGTRRIDTSPLQLITDFLKDVKTTFLLPNGGWSVWKTREKTRQLKATKARTLHSLKIKHGDMLYLHLQPQVTVMLEDTMEKQRSKDKQASLAASEALLTRGLYLDLSGNIVEDEVDQLLWKQDGTVPRRNNNKHCRHGPNGMCFTCVPYQPYDEEYLAKVTPPIKFLSFHSYIRKMTGGVDKGKYAQLETLSFTRRKCSRIHASSGRSQCLNCLPSSVTLQRQNYRHVDFIQFENHLMVERFLDYWRKTGNQRLGYLYGTYEYHEGVPLGIKAVVSAIYEPLQVSTKTSIELVQDEDDVVNSIASKLDLRKVGWIFTDLVPPDTSLGTIKHCIENVSSRRLLSAEECIMAADLQNRHPNPCQLSSEGHFGSKFVTVVVTGNSQKQIHFAGYQVSNACMALVRDGCLVRTKDATELYVKESTNEQFVPDMFYKETDLYGNEVTQLAWPLPVECLLTDMAVAFPKELAFTFFASEDIRPFSIENREGIGETQKAEDIAEYVKQFGSFRPMEMFYDFHLLSFLASSEVLPKEKINDLLAVLMTGSVETHKAFLLSPEWTHVERILQPFSVVRLPPYPQQRPRPCDDAVVPKEDTIVHALPTEVVEKFLIDVIADSVPRQMVNKQRWSSAVGDHVAGLGQVSETWKAILNTNYFRLRLDKRLATLTPRRERLQINRRNNIPDATMSVAALNGQYLLLSTDYDGHSCVKFYDNVRCRNVIQVLHIPDFLFPLSVDICALTGDIFLLCKDKAFATVIKIHIKKSGLVDYETIVSGSQNLCCCMSISPEGKIFMVQESEPKRVFVMNNTGEVEAQIVLPQGMLVIDILARSKDRFVLVSCEGGNRKYVEFDTTGFELQVLRWSCTESYSQIMDHLGRLIIFGVRILPYNTESCCAIFDVEFNQMNFDMTQLSKSRLLGCCKTGYDRERNQLLVYTAEDDFAHGCFLSTARIV